MKLNQRQLSTRNKIERISKIFGIDPDWAVAVALTESSLGEFQLSPTGAKGVFQMTSIAMKDLLLEMEKKDDDLIDIFAGIAFLYTLLKRHKTIIEATKHFCDPNDISFYINKVMSYIDKLKEARSNI